VAGGYGPLVERDVLTGKVVRRFDGMGEFTVPAALSPDGRLFAACKPKQGAQVWDLSAEKRLGGLEDGGGHALRPRYLAFSDRSDLLAAATLTPGAGSGDYQENLLLH